MQTNLTVVDIGCGQKKLPGSIGVDFSSMSDADVVLDLNTDTLPFDDSSVDYVYSSHCLEHLTTEGFLHVLREIYRVLKPNQEFFLTVPYFTSSANLANIFHNNSVCFNEHTFRFFSSNPHSSCLAPEDYATPSCAQWGLRYSANSEMGIEFETAYVNFHYFAEYQALSEAEKRQARQQNINVVDQISYLLKPIKPCPSQTQTAPIEQGSPTDFFSDQLNYLQGQKDYIEAHAIDKTALALYSTDFTASLVTEGIVDLNGHRVSIYEAITTLNTLIQQTQQRIDSHVAQAALDSRPTQ